MNNQISFEYACVVPFVSCPLYNNNMVNSLKVLVIFVTLLVHSTFGQGGNNWKTQKVNIRTHRIPSKFDGFPFLKNLYERPKYYNLVQNSVFSQLYYFSLIICSTIFLIVLARRHYLILGDTIYVCLYSCIEVLQKSKCFY